MLCPKNYHLYQYIQNAGSNTWQEGLLLFHVEEWNVYHSREHFHEIGLYMIHLSLHWCQCQNWLVGRTGCIVPPLQVLNLRKGVKGMHGKVTQQQPPCHAWLFLWHLFLSSHGHCWVSVFGHQTPCGGWWPWLCGNKSNLTWPFEVRFMSVKKSKSILRFLLSFVTPKKKISDISTGQESLACQEKISADSDHQVSWKTEIQKHNPAPEMMVSTEP